MANAEIYDAFISYNRKADEPLAAAIQRGLGALAKPWYRRRALRIFRDKTSLAASPEGWSSLVSAMERSRYLVLLASPEAARSPWVDKEVAWWRENRGVDTFLIAVTGGRFNWDDLTHDFDEHTKVPPSIRGWFTSVPFWADFRLDRGEDTFDLRDPRLIDPLADLAAPLRGMGKDELVGEDITQHRRALHQAWTVAALLVLLTIGAVVAAVVAIEQRQQAIMQRDIAQARALAATSDAERGSDPLASLRDALASLRTRRTPEGGSALRANLASPLRRILNPTQRVSELGFSPDGQYLAAADRGVTVWNLRGQGSEELSGHHASVVEVGFNATGSKILTVAGDDTAGVWTGVHQRTPKFIHLPQLASAAIAPDGITVALASLSGTVELTDAQGHVISVLPHRSGVSFANLQFSPDGQRLLGEGSDGTLQVWPATGSGRAVVLPSGAVTAARITTSETVVSLSRRGVVDVWGLDGAHLRSGAVGSYEVAAISPDGRRVALAAPDGTVSVVDGPGGAPRALGRHPGGGITALTFSSDGRNLASAAEGDTLVRIWDLQTAPPVIPPGGPFYAAALTFSPDGALVAGFESSGNDVAVWSASGGARRTLHNGPASILATVFDRRADGITTVADDGVERFLRIGGGASTTERSGLGSPSVAALSADATLFATAEENGPLRVWRSSGGPAVTLAARTQGAYKIVFSPDGRRVAVTDGTGTVKIWGVAGGPALQLRAPQPIALVTFNPNDTAIAGGSEATGSVYLWPKLNAGQKPTLLGRHLHFVNTLSFSPAGDQVASGGDDGQLRMWNVDGGPALALGSGQRAVDTLAFDPHGSGIATSSNEGKLGLWSCEFCGSIDRVIDVARRLENRGGLV